MSRENIEPQIFDRIREILESARSRVARTVNTTQVMANWLIGREIVEEEQMGKKRADYGKALLSDLAERLSQEFGKGWSVRQLEYCRSFYCSYPLLLEPENTNAVRSNSAQPAASKDEHIVNAVRAKLPDTRQTAENSETVRRELGASAAALEVRYAGRSESWQPGQLNPNLSWTHYRTLLQLYLPTVEELEQELQREMRYLTPPESDTERGQKP